MPVIVCIALLSIQVLLAELLAQSRCLGVVGYVYVYSVYIFQ